jgi:hypothetical protein
MLASDEMIRKRHSDLEVRLDAQGKEWPRLMLKEGLRLWAQRRRASKADGMGAPDTRDSKLHIETLLGRVPVPGLAYQARAARTFVR